MTVDNVKQLTALLTLLQDEDPKIASLAMEQFLNLGQETAEKTVAQYQESREPALRHRIHQLGSILARRRSRVDFIQDVADDRITLWEGVLQINSLYDRGWHAKPVEQCMDELIGRVRSGTVTTPKIAALFRDEEFAVPEESIQDVDLYLVQRVVETRYGSPAVLCAMAQHVAASAGWALTIVLHAGRFCLIDKNNLILDPSEHWHISKLGAKDRIHPCAKRDVLLGVLSQLFLVVLVEGQLRDLHHFGDLLTALNDASMDGLPFPLGGDQ